ncbi:MAG: hypothetical protein JNJ75_06430 [Cyclobacteriaceae bacterium]|nr:hypothetical protein [Cyclobacteriaceae bacterium]
MSFAEYSLVFISILVGYIVTVAMGGWGKLIKRFDAKVFSVLYLCWSLSMFFYLLFIWLWAFRGFSSNLDYLNSPSSLYFIIIRLLIIYFAVETLTPDGTDVVDFRGHFSQVAKKFYGILIVLWSYELLLYPLTGHYDLSPRMLLYLINLPISIALFFIKSEKVQVALAVICLAIQIFANVTVLEFL